MPLPSDMLAIEIATPGGPEVLKPIRRAVPLPKPGEVLIQVAAAGINAPDLGQRRGTYAPPPGASDLPGLEVGGIVVAGGTGATIAAGTPVVALTNGGGYAEYVAVPEGQVLPVPAGWSLIEGAALPETFFTVEQTLVQRAGLAADMDVLIHGAAGGIGGAAIGICRVFGARAIGVVSSDEKADYVLSLGAAEAIVHTREDFVARTKELTGGKGADRIVHMMGGTVLEQNVEASARGGHIVLVAALTGEPSNIHAGKLVAKWLTLSGSTLRPQSPEAKAAIADGLRRDVWPALENGTIRKPRIRTFRLDEAAAAHTEMEKRENYGKIVLVTAFGETP